MIQVGDKRAEIPTMEGGREMGPQSCRVVWVHPKKRFYTVEFIFPRDCVIRESYWLPRSRAE